jgi:hypothetical protein
MIFRVVEGAGIVMANGHRFSMSKLQIQQLAGGSPTVIRSSWKGCADFSKDSRNAAPKQ